MNKTLSIFMGIALTVTILVTLYYGKVFEGIKLKNEHHIEAIDQYQIQPK